jgi:hypothetical protein
MTDVCGTVYRSMHESRRETSLRRATALLKSVSSSAETIIVDRYSEMKPYCLISIRDASVQHKCTDQVCGSVMRRTITGTLYRSQPPPPLVISSSQQCQPHLLYHYWRALPTSGRLKARKSVADCQRPNDASNGTKTQGPMEHGSRVLTSTPSRFQDSMRGVGVKGS